jgi:hypothetical protein
MTNQQLVFLPRPLISRSPPASCRPTLISPSALADRPALCRSSSLNSSSSSRLIPRLHFITVPPARSLLLAPSSQKPITGDASSPSAGFLPPACCHAVKTGHALCGLPAPCTTAEAVAETARLRIGKGLSTPLYDVRSVKKRGSKNGSCSRGESAETRIVVLVEVSESVVLALIKAAGREAKGDQIPNTLVFVTRATPGGRVH